MIRYKLYVLQCISLDIIAIAHTSHDAIQYGILRDCDLRIALLSLMRYYFQLIAW